MDNGALGGLEAMTVTWNARDWGLILYWGIEFFSPSETTVTGLALNYRKHQPNVCLVRSVRHTFPKEVECHHGQLGVHGGHSGYDTHLECERPGFDSAWSKEFFCRSELAVTLCFPAGENVFAHGDSEWGSCDGEVPTRQRGGLPPAKHW